MSTPGFAKPRKRPSQARSKATVEILLTAAAQILVEEGYERATTNAIAERAGVSIGSLYQYFPNKEALVLALADRHVQQMMELLQAQAEQTLHLPLPHACRGLVQALLKAHAAAPGLYGVLIEHVPRIRGLEPLRRVDARIIDLFHRHLEARSEPLRPKDLDLAVFVLVHAVQAVTHEAVLTRPDALEDDALADEITELVLGYLLP